MTPPTPEEEAEAAKRFTVMNLVRMGSVAVLGIGILIAQEVIAAPYVAGVGLAVAGVAGFFFAPPLLVKRWKAQDRGEK